MIDAPASRTRRNPGGYSETSFLLETLTGEPDFSLIEEENSPPLLSDEAAGEDRNTVFSLRIALSLAPMVSRERLFFWR